MPINPGLYNAFQTPANYWSNQRHDDLVNQKAQAAELARQAEETAQAQKINDAVTEHLGKLANAGILAPDKARTQEAEKKYLKGVSDVLQRSNGDLTRFWQSGGANSVRAYDEGIAGDPVIMKALKNKSSLSEYMKAIQDGKSDVAPSEWEETDRNTGKKVKKSGSFNDNYNAYNLGLTDELNFGGTAPKFKLADFGFEKNYSGNGIAGVPDPVSVDQLQSHAALHDLPDWQQKGLLKQYGEMVAAGHPMNWKQVQDDPYMQYKIANYQSMIKRRDYLNGKPYYSPYGKPATTLDNFAYTLAQPFSSGTGGTIDPGSIDGHLGTMTETNPNTKAKRSVPNVVYSITADPNGQYWVEDDKAMAKFKEKPDDPSITWHAPTETNGDLKKDENNNPLFTDPPRRKVGAWDLLKAASITNGVENETEIQKFADNMSRLIGEKIKGEPTTEQWKKFYEAGGQNPVQAGTTAAPAQPQPQAAPVVSPTTPTHTDSASAIAGGRSFAQKIKEAEARKAANGRH